MLKGSAIIVAAATLMAAPTFAQEDGPAAGPYVLEKNHAYLTWNISHGGLSTYTGVFTDVDASLNFDPENPGASMINVTINPAAIETNYPDAEKKAEWETELAEDPKFFNVSEYPQITFASTAVEVTGENTGTVTGDLTLLGVTQPVTLEVTYNGTANMPWFGERDLIGFSASGVVKRSEFGMTALLPKHGDDVRVEFSGEFIQAE